MGACAFQKSRKLGPKRAGSKIWGKERVPIRFLDADNCKNPKWYWLF